MALKPASKRVLYIDDRVPRDVLGAGLPRSRQIMLGLRQLGHALSVYPVLEQEASSDGLDAGADDGMELVLRWPGPQIVEYLSERGADLDIIWISRLHNIVHVSTMLARHGRSLRALSKAVLVFDSEAVVAARDCSRAVASRKPILGSQLMTSLASEANVYRKADHVVCVSQRDQRMFADLNIHNTTVLGHVLDVDRSARGFDGRTGIVLVGNLLVKGSPNHVSANWFVRHVWPLVRQRADVPTLKIVGPINIDIAATLAGDGVEIVGSVANLAAVLGAARVGIAPTLFAGGLPHKVHETMSRGLPIVITSLLAEQLGASDPAIVVADDPPSFADAVIRLYRDEALWLRARQAGWDIVAKNCNRGDFMKQLQLIGAAVA